MAFGRRRSPRPQWAFAEMPSLEDETWLITGATRGLGLATAQAAARRGARLILAVRDAELGAAVAAGLGNAAVVELDLSDLRSVRQAAEHIGDVDVLINNAGGSTQTRRETPDGFEWHLGVNALAPFLFTNLILERVHRRVVIISSLTHHNARMDVEDPHFRQRRWTRSAAYGQSKLADLLWANALSRRLHQQGSNVDVQCAHPGWAYTNVGNPARTKIGRAMLRPLATRLANPVDQAALTTLFAATEGLAPCSFVGPDGPGQLRGCPRLVATSQAARDEALAARFWEFAEGETNGD